MHYLHGSVCVCVCVCVCTYAYMNCVCMCVCVRACMYVCMYVHTEGKNQHRSRAINAVTNLLGSGVINPVTAKGDLRSTEQLFVV